MSMILNGTDGVTFNDASLQGAAASPYVLKNRIINGAMMIDQRNAGASVTITTNGTYTLDRWISVAGASSKYSVQQNAGSVTPPAGFTKYLGVTSLSALATSSGDYYNQQQAIEGFNIADLAWGTANAKTVTLSFWVRSSLTGQFGGSLRNNTSTFYSYPFNYTISTANTWEQKSITIAGPTVGTWTADNTAGIQLFFNIGCGSSNLGTANSWQAINVLGSTGDTSVLATNGATWYLTGVQLEQNTSATPFERRLYNQELANCQRYYSIFWVGVDWVQGNYAAHGVTYPVTMRASPTVTAGGGSLSSNISALSIPVGAYSGTSGTTFQAVSTTINSRAFYFNYYTASAEL